MDRTITQEDAKLFEVQGVVMDLTALAVDCSPDTEFHFANPVPILDDRFVGIGHADVFKSGDKILFTGAIRYDTPARLDIENDGPVYVRPYGSAEYWDESPNIWLLEHKPILRKFSVETLRFVAVQSTPTQSRVRRLDNATILQDS